MDVSQYLEIFIDESAEHLQTLSDCIMTLEKEPDNKDTINEVFRAAHSFDKKENLCIKQQNQSSKSGKETSRTCVFDRWTKSIAKCGPLSS